MPTDEEEVSRQPPRVDSISYAVEGPVGAEEMDGMADGAGVGFEEGAGDTGESVGVAYGSKVSTPPVPPPRVSSGSSHVAKFEFTHDNEKRPYQSGRSFPHAAEPP